MIKSIHHTAISTGDFERAVAFYRDLLGFEMVAELNWPAGARSRGSRAQPHGR
jgi:catechol 2,3-dioxygenase-like lactoylglutathione lyase family enzyme